MFTSGSAEALHDSGSSSAVRVGREDRPRIEVSQATAEDIAEFYGGSERRTIRALVSKLDSRVVGILGVARENGYGKYFCDYKEELEPYLKSVTIMRAVKASLKFCDDYRGPMIAVADHAEGCRILHRLGFEHLHGAYYAWLK